MKIEFYGAKDCGRKYKHNEDFISLPNKDNFLDSKSMNIFVLCDGVGGGNSGEVASQLTATWLQKDFNDSVKKRTGLLHKIVKFHSKKEKENLKILINNLIQNINEKIYNLAQEHQEYENMGTTLVSALIYDNNLIIHSIGDSRCYRIRKDEMMQLTEDQSEVWKLFKMGAITKEEMRTHPRNNVITSAIGMENLSAINQYFFEIEKEDLYLMCSDGLSDMLSDEEIQKTINNGINLEEIVKNLIEKANNAGGKDNISLILLKA